MCSLGHRVTCVGGGRNCLGRLWPVPRGSAAAGNTTLCPKTTNSQSSTWSLEVFKKGWKLSEARDIHLDSVEELGEDICEETQEMFERGHSWRCTLGRRCSVTEQEHCPCFRWDRVLSMQCNPSGTSCSGVASLRGHKPCQQTCSIVSFSLHESTGPARSLLQHGLSMGSLPPSGIHLVQSGVPSTGYRWISAPSWASVDCRRTACLTMVFITGCGGVSAPVPVAPPPPPSSLTLVSAELFLSHHLARLSFCSFVPLLNSVIPEALTLSLMGSALASDGSVLEPAGTGFI